jgi:hypothetical protein
MKGGTVVVTLPGETYELLDVLGRFVREKFEPKRAQARSDDSLHFGVRLRRRRHRNYANHQQS